MQQRARRRRRSGSRRAGDDLGRGRRHVNQQVRRPSRCLLMTDTSFGKTLYANLHLDELTLFSLLKGPPLGNIADEFTLHRSQRQCVFPEEQVEVKQEGQRGRCSIAR
ncbi:hypothetical protein E2C01_089268 [Portunus trituberculatus]|uniref:Uncharacterized protein n=1 Tax=Portunus trituberculatus TaxID=210409 RepID=A0A5B7JIN0_PORTR|nr:hypothetical protein [Portunus trituberculatus]